MELSDLEQGSRIFAYADDYSEVDAQFVVVSGRMPDPSRTSDALLVVQDGAGKFLVAQASEDRDYGGAGAVYLVVSGRRHRVSAIAYPGRVRS